MKKEVEDIFAERAALQPAQPSNPDTALKAPDMGSIPRSIEMMASVFYELSVNRYGLDGESFRYGYAAYLDGTFELHFSSDRAAAGSVMEEDYSSYLKYSALLADLCVQLDDDEREVFIDPQNLLISCTDKMALLDIVASYIADEENEIYAVDMVEPLKVIREDIVEPQGLPTDPHSAHETRYILAHKFKLAAETDEFTKLVSDAVFVPRAYASGNEYYASQLTMLDAHVRTSLAHIMRTIQHEEGINTHDIPDTFLPGGFH